MKYFLAIFAVVFLCLTVGYFWYTQNLAPVSTSAETVTFTVQSGESAKEVIQRLKSANLLRSYLASRIYLRLHSFVFRPGIYYLPANLSLNDLFDHLDKGPKDIKITFPEGWRREQYAARLKANFPDFDVETFLSLTATLEGQLFPDTYYLPVSPSAQKVVSILTTNFQKKSGLAPNQSDILILASLIERESNHPADSQLIAGIMLKRLQNGWPLQIDATVQYAKDSEVCRTKLLNCDWWKPIFDTKFDSKYNTYLSTGLPPSPIANPGLVSIQSALNPKTSDFWYYLTGNDGTTYFAKDLATHQMHIDRYLKP